MIEATPDSSATATPASIAEPITNAIVAPINNAAFFDQLADVALPAEPSLWPTITAVAITLIAIGLIYLRYRLRDKQSATPTKTIDTAQQALERLLVVEQAWSNGKIDTRETAYRLSTLLRLGLNLPQLTNRCPPLLTDNQGEWQQMITLFDQLRYQTQTAQTLTGTTFNQLRQWLTIAQSPTINEGKGEHHV